MKIKLDIDCTPEEARAFFGLPDVRPMQETLIAQLQGRIGETMAAMDPEALIKTWMPSGMQGFEQMQKAFWSQMAGTGKPSSDKDKT